MRPVHLELLDAALSLATPRSRWTFRVAEIVRILPHLNAGTVRTHVASRCCVNAPSHHQSRHAYFRALGRGVYRVESAYRTPSRRRTETAWQDRVLASIDSGVDSTLIAESMKRTPTERLEQMRHAAQSLDAIVRP